MWFRKHSSAVGNTLEIVYVFSFFLILANVSIGGGKKKTTGQFHKDTECMPLMNSTIYS